LRSQQILSYSRKSPRTLWSSEVHYSIQNSPPPVHILSQVNPLRTPAKTFLQDPFLYYPPIYAYVFKFVSFSSHISPQNPCLHLSSPTTRATSPAQLIFINYITGILVKECFLLVIKDSRSVVVRVATRQKTGRCGLRFLVGATSVSLLRNPHLGPRIRKSGCIIFTYH
jgi:hypothetical protein